MRLGLARSLHGLLIAISCVLSACIAGPGSTDTAGGKKLECIEIESGCRCAITPILNQKVIEECSASSINAPDGTSAHCCAESLVLNGQDQGVYMCDCRAMRCVASDRTCSCEPIRGVMPAQSEAVVDDCSAFAAARPAVKCCANGDRCQCSDSPCGASSMEVPFCSGDSLCGGIGEESVASCK